MICCIKDNMNDLNLENHLVSQTGVALALGGGGARGIAHIIVLEVLDELGVKPIALSGSSMGAIIATLYASGLTGRDIRAFILEIAHNRTSVLRRLLEARVGRFLDIFAKGFMANPMLIDGEKFLDVFLPAQVPHNFSALNIPVNILSTDFYGQKSKNFTSGALRPALAASMAIPGLLRPVLLEGRVYIDGGALNPVPVSAVSGNNRIIIAVNVNDNPKAEEGSLTIPDPLEVLYGSVSLMMNALTRYELAQTPPDILINPLVGHFNALDFFKANEILEVASLEREQLKRKLARLLAL
jgi:NTE family protein